MLEKGKLREYIENIASDDNTQYYIILDEIQLVENFVRTINFLNKHKNRKKNKKLIGEIIKKVNCSVA